MKKVLKTYLSLLFAFCIIISNITCFAVSAEERITGFLGEPSELIVEAPIEYEGIIETNEELMPSIADECEDDDDYYIQGLPNLPDGSIPISELQIGTYVSPVFLDFVFLLGLPTDGWDYYMQDYLAPNGQIIYYHYWANEDDSLPTFYHKR